MVVNACESILDAEAEKSQVGTNLNLSYYKKIKLSFFRGFFGARDTTSSLYMKGFGSNFQDEEKMFILHYYQMEIITKIKTLLI